MFTLTTRSPRIDTLVPYTTHFRSVGGAEVLVLQAHEHAGDIGGADEAQRKRAGGVALGGVQLLGGRSLLCHASPLLADEVEGFADPSVLGRGAAVDQVAVVVAGEEIGRAHV